VEKLKKLRGEAGITQKEMAKKLGISESYYCLLENEKRRMPLNMALKIASILETTPNDVFLSPTLAECEETQSSEAVNK